MIAKHTFTFASPLATTGAAMVAAIFAISLLTVVAFLFQREGAPMAQIVAIEQACAQHAYVSELETCVRQRAALMRSENVASQ
jgi:hypothetical protein